MLPPSSAKCKEPCVYSKGLQSAGQLILLRPVFAAWIRFIFRHQVFFFNFFHSRTTLLNLDLLIVEVSRSHSVEILWRSDRPFAETFTWQHPSLPRDRHPWPPAEFGSPIPVNKRLQTHTLDGAVTGTGSSDVQIRRLLSHHSQLGLHSSSDPWRPSFKTLYAFQDARCVLHNRFV